MAATKKFMFETIFEDLPSPDVTASQLSDEDEGEEVTPDEEIPSFSEEDLEAARKEGFKAGKEEGVNASLDSTEKRIAATLANLEKEVTRLIDEQKNANEEISHLAMSIAVAIARKMLPEMAARNALNEIEWVIAKALPRIIEEPRINIRVHGDIEPEINSRIEKWINLRDYEGLISVTPENDLAVGDCQLEWSCGGADRNSGALWREIDNIIMRNVDKTLVMPTEEMMEEAPDEVTETADPDSGITREEYPLEPPTTDT